MFMRYMEEFRDIFHNHDHLFNDYTSILSPIVHRLQTSANVELPLPKIAFTFWEGREFTSLHAKTIQSFSTYHPDFQIIIYQTNQPTDIQDTWDTPEHKSKITNHLCDIYELRSCHNVEFRTIDISVYHPSFASLSAVHKSDIIRIIKLQEHGGIWIDFDILFFKRIPDRLLMRRRNHIGIFAYHRAVAIGFIFSHPNQPLLDFLLKLIYQVMKRNEPRNMYQLFGSVIWTTLIRTPILCNYLELLSNDICYSYLYHQLDVLYQSHHDLRTNDSIAIHWYNGAAESKNYIQHRMVHPHASRCIMDSILRQVESDISIKNTHDKRSA